MTANKFENNKYTTCTYVERVDRAINKGQKGQWGRQTGVGNRDGIGCGCQVLYPAN